jgi:hypothetical protein
VCDPQRVILTDNARGVGPQVKACGSLTRRKAFWGVLSVSFTGGVRGVPGQAGEFVPSCLAKARSGGNDSCRSAGADNRRCP